jgi:hypothetical protein
MCMNSIPSAYLTSTRSDVTLRAWSWSLPLSLYLWNQSPIHILLYHTLQIPNVKKAEIKVKSLIFVTTQKGICSRFASVAGCREHSNEPSGTVQTANALATYAIWRYAAFSLVRLRFHPIRKIKTKHTLCEKTSYSAAEICKHMFKSRPYIAGQNHCLMTANKFIEMW